MRLAFVYLASGILLASMAPSAAQQAPAPQPTEDDTVIVLEPGPAESGPIVGWGTPTTFDTLRMDVRESLRPPQTFGPEDTRLCSPSVPDCQ
jgi:hypothetical protein